MKQTNTFSRVSKNSPVKMSMKLQANEFTSALRVVCVSGVGLSDEIEDAQLDLKIK